MLNYNPVMMKHSAPEMAIKILEATFNFDPDIRCFLGVGCSTCVIYCDIPRKLVILVDPEEQRYLKTDSITNKHSTNTGFYYDILVMSLSEM